LGFVEELDGNSDAAHCEILWLIRMEVEVEVEEEVVVVVVVVAAVVLRCR